ncbi:MAG: response regulator [Gammaproteobacteria bacterium]|nr:response regulator [Gammaproteobacteria bacterium]
MKDKPHILLVDDDPFLLQLMSLVFEQAGYRVDSAADGSAARDHVEQQPYDLIILDMQMPVMDGLGFLNWLRVEHKSQIPVCVLTAENRDRIEDRIRQAGADWVGFKPIDTQVLLDQAHQILAN